MHTLTLPAGTVARLQIIQPPLAASLPFVVVLADTAGRATPESFFEGLAQSGALQALLTHDLGVSWPDPRGEALLAGVLKRGGIVLLGFGTLADAMAAKAKAEALIAPGGGE